QFDFNFARYFCGSFFKAPSQPLQQMKMRWPATSTAIGPPIESSGAPVTGQIFWRFTSFWSAAESFGAADFFNLAFSTGLALTLPRSGAARRGRLKRGARK